MKVDKMEKYKKDTLIHKPADNNYEIHPLIRNRWSPRMFSNEAISDDELYSLFEGARWAASSNNLQPWRFIYIRKETEAWKKAFDCLAEFNQQWVDHCQLLIITIIKEKLKNGRKNFHALHDLGLAVGNMSLQAQSMGIALHQMAGIDWKKGAEVFNIPEGYHISTAIAVGKYGGQIYDLTKELREAEIKPRKRKKLSEIVSNNNWNENLL